MDTLPLETLQRIFKLACTDGGYTGHALSLVSKRIRAAARATRFHSISLIASPHRLQLFVALYERECAPALGDKPRIQHLHIAFPVTEHEPLEGTSSNGTAVSWPLAHSRSLEPAPSPLAEGNVHSIDSLRFPPHRDAQPSIWKKPVLALSRYRTAAMQKLPGRCRARHHDRQATFPYHESISIANRPGPTTYEDYLGEAQALFRLITPDLVTLVVQCGFSGAGDLDLPIVGHPFPQLLEASFVGVADPLTLVSRTDGTTAAPLFPAMTHLHIAPPFLCSIWHSGFSLPFWFTHAPFVTHLGVSCADDHTAAIASAVGMRVDPELNAYGLWPLDDDSSDPGTPPTPTVMPSVPAYPTVRHLLLQPSPGPVCHIVCCGNVREGYDNRMRVLRGIESRCKAAGIVAVEAKAPEDGLFFRHYELARRRWLERMNDGRDEAGGWSGR